MSDISNEQTHHAIFAGLVVDIAEEKFAEAQRLLKGIPGGAKKAIGSALARAGHAGQTVAKRSVIKEYNINGSTFLNYTRNLNRFVGEGMIDFGFQGNLIPLIRFSFVSGTDRVAVNVRKDTGVHLLDHAFVASMHGHLGIYEREGRSRLPIRELYGPATPQMMYSNEEVLDSVEEKVAETFSKRIDHEIERIMNGWGT